jgi:phosphate starvation-inducible protein PhoH and related proteins
MAVRESIITPLVPMNNLQAEYIHQINHKKMVVATGLPGTSKTYIPTVIACDMWRRGEISKIYLTRPNISNSKSLGFFGGSVVEKMSHWLMPILDTMNRRLGKGTVEIGIKNGDIAFVPLETIKGMSFGGDSFVICDEAEDLTIKEISVLVARQGGCKMVLAGDIEQSDIGPGSGLGYIRDVLEHSPELEKFAGFIDFNSPSHIVRSSECRAWILALRRYNKK